MAQDSLRNASITLGIAIGDRRLDAGGWRVVAGEGWRFG